jgi:hypothetical protein
MVSLPHVVWQVSANAEYKHSNGARSETIKNGSPSFASTYPDLKVGENERGILQVAQKKNFLTCYTELSEKVQRDSQD